MSLLTNHYSLSKYINAFCIIRPLNCLNTVMLAIVGIYLGHGSLTDLPWNTLAIALMVVAIIVAFGHVVNDYYDAPIDALGKPDRAIPSGALSRRSAGIIAACLAVFGLGLASALNMPSILITIICLTLSYTYTIYLRSIPLVGHAVMGVLGGMTVIYGGMIVGFVNVHNIIAAILIFSYLSAHELMGGIRDCTMDEKGGLRTTVTYFGKERSLQIFQIEIFVFCILTLIPAYLDIASKYYIYSVAFLIFPPMIGVILAINYTTSNKTIVTILKILRICWFVGLIPLILLR